MFDYNAIKQQVLDYIESHENDYDVEQIVDDLRFASRKLDVDVTSVDQFDSVEFQDILIANELEERED